MKYEHVGDLAKEDIRRMLSSSCIEDICKALVSMALYNLDWKESQDVCLKFLDYNNDNVKSAAITGLCHIARIHRKLEKEKVLNALEAQRINRALNGHLDDAIADIEMYIA